MWLSFPIWEEEQARRELGKASLTLLETHQCAVFTDVQTEGLLVHPLLQGWSEPLAEFPGDQSLLRQHEVSEINHTPHRITPPTLTLKCLGL